MTARWSGNRRVPLLALPAALVLAGCVDRLLVEPAAPTHAALSLAVVPAPAPAAESRPGWAAAFDAADRARVTVSQGETPLYDDTLALAADSAGTQVRLELELSDDEETVAVAFELLGAAGALFHGDTTIIVRAGEEEQTLLRLQAVPAQVLLEQPAQLSALGDTAVLRGTALFATGDTITAALTWEVLDPAIVALVDTGRVVSVRAGTARIVGSYDVLADTVDLTVALSFEPAAVGVGHDHACAITQSRTVWCWGTGLLGAGPSDAPHATTPIQTAGGHAFVTLAVGEEHSCALTIHGTAYCWGMNYDGELGLPPSDDANEPTPVSTDLEFAAIAAGGRYTCALTPAGVAYCWGSNEFGQLGDGTNTPSDAPVAVAGGLTFTAIVTGSQHTCALTAAGAAYCWGQNDGQIGDGTTTHRPTPVAVTGGLAFQSIAAGVGHTCGVARDGTGYCWGGGGPQLGTGGIDAASSPVEVAGGLVFSRIAAGQFHTCALTTDGSAYCWGGNGSGQLGDDTRGIDRASPVPVSHGHTFADIDGGWHATCAVRTDGVLYCWGAKAHGLLGTGELGFRAEPGPISGGITFRSVHRGHGHGCGLSTTDEVYCWGGNEFGAVGDGTSGNGDAAVFQGTPVQISGATTISTLETGLNHSCALTLAGEAYCWGGSFGDFSHVAGPEPYTAISARGHHACAIGESGAAYCWGENIEGTLGDGTTTNSSTPVAVQGGLSFTAIGTNHRHSCGITTSGAAYCWGDNILGQLGDGTGQNSTTPVAVQGGLAFVAIALGPDHTCALTPGGTAYCWGDNWAGHLGDGTREQRLTPVPVTGGHTFAHLSAGGAITCGVTDAEEAYCWGNNHFGELGVGEYLGQRDTPHRVAGGYIWAMVDVGATGGGGCGVTTDGVGHCWGQHGAGNHGDGSHGFHLAPAAVAAPAAATPAQLVEWVRQRGVAG